MKQFDNHAFEEVRTWIHQNARPLELAVWNCRYENGSPEDIVKELAYYQNEDGGFGRGIEPDCLNRESSPYATTKAIDLIMQNNLMEKTKGIQAMVQAMLHYLDHCAHQNEEGWYFSIPSNDSAPRAPWWTYSEEENQMQNLGVTAKLSGFILAHCPDSASLYQKALRFARGILEQAQSRDELGEMGMEGICILLEVMRMKGLGDSGTGMAILEKLKVIADGAIERDPEQWCYYKPRPSSFILSPSSPFYCGNEEIVERQLDYLIDTRVAGGVWNITWSWFNLGEVYPKEFAISENWWKTIVAMGNLEFLHAFGRCL